MVLVAIRSRGRMIIPDNQSCRVKDFDGLRRARPTNHATRSAANYNRSDVTTLVRRILRDWTNHRRVLPTRYLECALSAIPITNSSFSSLSEISRFRVWLTHDLHRVRVRAKRTRCCIALWWLLFRAREPRRCVCLLRCDALRLECHKFALGFPEVKLSCVSEMGMDRRSRKSSFFSIKFSSFNLVEKIHLRRIHSQSLLHNPE